MTSTHAYYLVAYPHPTASMARRIKRLELGSDAVRKDIVALLKDSYPDHSGDLNDATLWKVSRSTEAQSSP